MNKVIAYQKNNQVKFLNAPEIVQETEMLLAEHNITEHILMDMSELPDLAYKECFMLKDGFLSINMEKAKAQAHNIRKSTISALYMPHDEIFMQIYALKIPSERFSKDQEQAILNAEAKREEIYKLSQEVKNFINQAETIDDIKEAIKLLDIC